MTPAKPVLSDFSLLLVIQLNSSDNDMSCLIPNQMIFFKVSSVCPNCDEDDETWDIRIQMQAFY